MRDPKIERQKHTQLKSGRKNEKKRKEKKRKEKKNE
jgi:hypothetical protein